MPSAAPSAAPAAAPPKTKLSADHLVGISNNEYAWLCYLRLTQNHAVAASYGITMLNKQTSIGSMLLQTLGTQGVEATLYQRLPNGGLENAKTPKRWPRTEGPFRLLRRTRRHGQVIVSSWIGATLLAHIEVSASVVYMAIAHSG